MKKRWIYGAVILIVIIGIIIYSTSSDESSVEITTVVKKGEFNVLVSTTGELQALNSTEIRGPEDLREARVHNVKIVDLIPEGTIVAAGDYVGSLDRTEATDRLQNMLDELEQAEASYRQIILDTTMTLRDYRNTIKDLEYGLEEKQIVLDQSQYEPPATIRQAEMNLDKSKRAYEQAVTNYSLKKEQANATIVKADINLKRQHQQRDDLINVLNQFEIYAPQPGMVIYKKEWGGAKRKVGSSISPWDPVVATLPDLSTMISKTYVNEIDISKLEAGQVVTVGVDAFPDQEYTGKVIDVANVGEQLSSSDAKVFEVVVQLNETDTTLRPAMTTVNEILTGTFEDVVYIPLETVHSTDSMSYVLKADRKIRQIVDLAESNENFILVTEGLEEGEEIYLTVPLGSEEWETQGWDIYEKVKQRRLDEEKRKREEGEARRNQMEELKKSQMDKFDMENLPDDQKKRVQQMMQKGGGSGQMGRGSSSGQAVQVRVQR